MMGHGVPAVPASRRGAGCVPRLPASRPAAAGLPPGATAWAVPAGRGRAGIDRGPCIGAERPRLLPRRASGHRAAFGIEEETLATLLADATIAPAGERI